MSTIRNRIFDYLQVHPEGASDDDLWIALQLKQRMQANTRCRELAADGLIVRQKHLGKYHNYPLGSAPPVPIPPPVAVSADPTQLWHWEGNVQLRIIDWLRSDGFNIVRSADTASREPGKDIEAEKDGVVLWVTAKGYPTGTKKTSAGTQARHWFRGAFFDLLVWRGLNKEAEIALALPQFPTYRNSLAKVSWLQAYLRFTVFWVGPDSSVTKVNPEGNAS